MTKQGQRLPAAAMAAYRAAGGGAEGCCAALEVLDAVDRLGEGDIDEVYRRAYATPSQLMAVRFAGTEWPMPPERKALVDEIEAARATYRALVSPHERGHVPIPEPASPQERAELEQALWARIRSLPDHDPVYG